MLASVATHRVRLGALMGLAGLIGALTSSVTAAPDHVVIALIDGPRYTETLGTPSHIPNLRDSLGGAILTEFRNTGATATIPGHASIVTGTWQHIANDGTERPHHPTLFERLRAETGLPPESVWLVGGKTKLSAVAASDDPTMGLPFGARHTVGLAGDTATLHAALDVLETWTPTLTLVSFSDTDLRAHAGSWDGYLAAIATADSLIGELWRFLSDTEPFAGRTTLIVTADHGRHDNRPEEPHDGFSRHGDHCRGCEHILFVAAGSGIQRGVTLDTPHDQRDIAATVAAMLGIGADDMDGRVIADMLDASAIPPEPVGGPRLVMVHPQPFTARGQIMITSPTPGHVRLDIYDLAGRHLRRLSQVQPDAAPVPITWDGVAADGVPAATGVYFLRVTAAGRRTGGRLVLIR